jgi:hypothetical protein
LIDLCINHAESLLLSLPGARVLKEVYIHFSSEELVNAIMQVCESTLEQDKATEALSLFEHPTGHRAIKNLIMCDAEKNTTRFSEAFLERLDGKLVDVAGSNRGAFVVAALFKVKSIQPKVLKVLRSQKKEVMNLSKQSKSNAGYDALLKEIF